MTKRKTPDTRLSTTSCTSSSSHIANTSTAEEITLNLNLLPGDILGKIAEDTADHDALRELSRVSQSLRSTLFEVNPWSQLINNHFPEAPVPTDANAAQRAYDGLIKTEYFYFSPFMMTLFTAVKNNDLRRVTQLVSEPEFTIEMLPSYTDRHGRCLLTWVMLKQNPDMIEHFKNLLTQYFEHNNVTNLNMLISQAKILAHTGLLSSIASHNIPQELKERVERNIQCGQAVNENDLDQLNLSQCAQLLYLAAEYRHIDYFQRLFERLSKIENNLLNMYLDDPFQYIYDAANKHDREFLQANYTIFVSMIRLKNKDNERNIHRLDYLCGRLALNIDFDYRDDEPENLDIFLEQQADFLADAIVLDDLDTIKNIIENQVANCLLNNPIGFKRLETPHFAIYYQVSYATFHYLINQINFEPEEALVYDCFLDAVGSNLIPHALLLAHYTLSPECNEVKIALDNFTSDLMDNNQEPRSSCDRAFLDGLQLLFKTPNPRNDLNNNLNVESDDDDSICSVPYTMGANTP